MLIINTNKVEGLEKSVRFLDYCVGLFVELPTRNSVKKAIKRGELLLNDQRGEQGKWLSEGDIIKMVDLGNKVPKEYSMVLEVVYEDNFLAVINKPAGIVVSGNQYRTIENALGANLKLSDAPDALKWPKPVHRLDGPTSGLLLVAKTRLVHAALGKQFETRSIEKEYHAVVKGKTPSSGTYNLPIEGHSAITEYKLLECVESVKNNFVSMVQLFPKTGRTHQLRIHLANDGHAIIGDKIHDKAEETIRHKGLFLAAVGLKFQHPIDGKIIDLHIDTPHKLKTILERELRMWKKHSGLL